MLFNSSCSMCLRLIWSFVRGIGTADMTKQGKRGSCQCLNVCFDIGEQSLKVAPLMMGDDLYHISAYFTWKHLGGCV
jgi:hypothetical protein